MLCSTGAPLCIGGLSAKPLGGRDTRSKLTTLLREAREHAGAVDLTGARISGQLDCSKAHLHNAAGAALSADGLEVGQDILLRSGFIATGSGDRGAVRLPGAHITGQLDLSEAQY